MLCAPLLDPPPRAPANGRPGFPFGFLGAGGRLPKARRTARDPWCFSKGMGMSQHRMARHDQSRLACVGWRLCVQPTAIAPYHPIRVASLGRLLEARAKSSARVPKVARRRQHTFDLGGGWASRHFTEVPTRRSASTELGDDGELDINGKVVGDGSSPVVGDGLGMGDDAGIDTADRGWRLADRKHCAWTGRRRDRHRSLCWSRRGRRRRDRHGRWRRKRQGVAPRSGERLLRN